MWHDGARALLCFTFTKTPSSFSLWHYRCDVSHTHTHTALQLSVSTSLALSLVLFHRLVDPKQQTLPTCSLHSTTLPPPPPPPSARQRELVLNYSITVRPSQFSGQREQHDNKTNQNAIRATWWRGGGALQGTNSSAKVEPTWVHSLWGWRGFLQSSQCPLTKNKNETSAHFMCIFTDKLRHERFSCQSHGWASWTRIAVGLHLALHCKVSLLNTQV